MSAPDGSEHAGFPGGFPPSEWIEKATDDLRVAEDLARRADDAYNDAIVFHCQQAVEKLMKAAMVSRGVAPPKVHDLPELWRRLDEAGVKCASQLTDLRKVTVGAVHSRYPGYVIGPEDTADILRITRGVWASLRPLI